MLNLRTILDLYYKAYWNKYFPKTNVIYEAQPNKHVLITEVVNTFDSADENKQMQDFFTNSSTLSLNSDDKKAIYTLNWVRENCVYYGDPATRKTPEFWNSPWLSLTTWFIKNKDSSLTIVATNTLTKPAEYPNSFRAIDCEDGAILINKILQILGVPAWKRRLVASDVAYNGGITGHCYFCYLTQGSNDVAPEWYVLDWCYWPDKSLSRFKNIPVRQLPEYNPDNNSLWFSFNEEFMWAQHNWDSKYKPGLVENEDVIL